MTNLKLVPKIVGYKFFRYLNAPKLYPFNLTMSVTNECISRCKTCNVWKEKKKDMGLEEWRKVLKTVGKCPEWITLSGGEPFLRGDLVSIIRVISKYNSPYVISIGTNGMLTDKIESDIKEILSFYNKHLIVNLSVDGLNAKHDFIRGVECFDKVLETYERLKNIKGLTVGVHSVISKYNVKDVLGVYDFFEKSDLQSYICEIAQNRVELNNLKDDISPSKEEYSKMIDLLLGKQKKSKGISRVTQLLRKKYYKLSSCYSCKWSLNILIRVFQNPN